MEVEIDIDRLRRDLMDYYGTALISASPIAVVELSKVESASDMELVELAQKSRIDLNGYIV